MKLRAVDILKEMAAFAGYVAGIAWIVVHWNQLPDQVPIHFGVSGQPDGWAPKPAILITPAAATFVYITMTIGQYFGKPNVPWRITPENRARIYEITHELIWWLKLQITWMFAYIQYTQVEVALGHKAGLGASFTPLFLGMVLFTLALYFFIGNKLAQGK